jgi:hypothetical protein
LITTTLPILKEEPLQVIFNLDEDIEEMKIAKGIEDDDAA